MRAPTSRERSAVLPVLVVLVLAAQPPSVRAEAEPAEAARVASDANGFALEGLKVARSALVRGGPKDGIKAVDEPRFASAEEAARWVVAGNPVVGVALGDEAHAYPVHLFEYHQVVNDVLDGTPVVVTYDPIAGMPAAYRREAGGRGLSFGVSGLIYRSNFVLYDRQTQSLWSHFDGRAIAGPLAGSALERVRTRQEPFGVWMSRHPESSVLARPFPRKIDYRYSPFSTYWVSEKTPFPLDATDARFHPKEVVLGVEVEGGQRAYLGSILTAEGGRIVDEFRGHKLRIAYDSASATFSWEAPEEVRVSDAYWFAWKNLHPDTEVWNEEAASGSAPSRAPESPSTPSSR